MTDRVTSSGRSAGIEPAVRESASAIVDPDRDQGRG